MNADLFGGYRFNHYGRYLRERFGQRVYKIMVDGGFTCPNRDDTKGQGGCIYCNNEAFTVGIIGGGNSVSFQVKEALGKKEGKKKFRDARFLVYFQKYSNTYGDVAYLEKVYREALVSEKIAGIVIGTRPDCIDEEIVALLGTLAGETYLSVELGLQTVDDRVLSRVNRGHGLDDFFRATELLGDSGIEFGVHLIYGLPGDSRENFIEGARKVSDAGASLVKLNHIHVVRETELEKMWREGRFTPPTYQEYLAAVCDFLEHLSSDATVARLIGTTPEKYLLAPKWDKGSAGFIQDVSGELERRGTYQGAKRSL
jgi:radical SAM protein (TIGR01212 family)